MTTEVRRLLLGTGRTLFIAMLLATAWFVATAAVLAATDKAEAVTAIFPRDLSNYSLPSDIAAVSWNGNVGRLVGRYPGYVLDLYRSGAIAVLPARRQGCLDLAKLRLSGSIAGDRGLVAAAR